MADLKNNVGSRQNRVVRRRDRRNRDRDDDDIGRDRRPEVVDPSNNTGVATHSNSNSNSSTTSTSSTQVISETAALYMRAKTVTFTATGLRPNSVYYPFFNGVYVGNYCSTVNGQRTSAIKTNNLGDVVGNFYLPGGVFTAGIHTFLLVDNITTVGGITTADELYSSASADYTANGILKLLQTTITNETVIIDPPTPVDPVVKQCVEWEYEYTFRGDRANRFWRVTWVGLKGETPPAPVRPSGVPLGSGEWVIRKPWFIKQASIVCPLQIGVQTVKRVDPLAQTFFIDAAKYPNGVFVTAITLYFRTVDQSTPAIVELRDVVNGYPGPNILPGGQAYRPGRSNSQSNNSSVGTTFKFDEPVYLEANLDYCFVVKSSSLGYNIWCSKQGDNDRITGKLITDTKVPGMMFKSSNDSTWTTDQLEDIKFDLWIAQFNTNIASYILFDPLKDITTNGVSVTFTDTGDLVTRNNHGLANRTPVMFSSISSTTGISINTTYYVVSSTTNTFQLADTIDGSPKALTNNGSGTLVVGTNNFYNTAQTIPLSYISTTNTSSTVGIQVPMHGLVTGDFVYIDDLPQQDYNGIAWQNLTGAFEATVIDDDNITIIAKNSDVATSTSRILAGDALQVLDLVPSVLPSGQTFETADLVTNVDNYSPSTIPETPATPTRPSAPSKANLTSFTIFTNVMANEVMIDYIGTEFADVTTIVEKIRIPEGYSTSADGGDETPYNEKPFVEIDNDGTFHEFDEPRLFASPRNETLHTAELNGSTSLRVNIEMASTDPNISPVIDVNGMSVIVRSHKIDNQNGEIDDLIDAGIEANFQDPDYNSEIEAGTGVAASKYKSTINLLQEPANNLVLFVMGICPSPAVFDAYIRTSNDESTHADKDWTWVDINGEFGTAFNNSPDRKTMVEWRFNYATTEPFTVFDIKLVMRSKNNSIVPKIYSIRALTNRMI
jgi:hypothetical protein